MTGEPLSAPRPCDVYAADGAPCVAAYSSARALFADYAGALYQVERHSDRARTDIGVTAAGGYANASYQDGFCAATRCTVTTIYDQSDQHNNLIPQGPTTAIYSNFFFPHEGVDAAALPITVDGRPAYGFKFVDAPPGTGPSGGQMGPCEIALTCFTLTGYPGQAYNNGNIRARGVAVNDEPESMYAVFGGTHSGRDCCFDFGNSEISGTDTGNGHMDALNFSRACWNACGPGDGPWVQADLENGMFMTGTPTEQAENYRAKQGGTAKSGLGFCCAATADNKAMPYPFVTAVLDNPGSQTFAIRGADANGGQLETFYDGPTPPGPGYSPMQKEGAIILGSGGDQGTTDGEFFEGAMTFGVPSATAHAAVQANIASAHYTMR
ncbi:arabinofuranosidase catalytic domain-containing protein [Rhodococcus maanshanensis]|uniref:arabinofuranosidase catalytic domain-containing protein n=1 Tax=Rhodococcus maanshanensis TaxID=183556 RepID=UPI00147608CB|nr:arabinofuranosidase catalytic domain-containing protein [Rhodococcus maanshanensis]